MEKTIEFRLEILRKLRRAHSTFHLHVDGACRTCALLQATTKSRIKPKMCSVSAAEPCNGSEKETECTKIENVIVDWPSRGNCVLELTERFVNFATNTYRTPSECCCMSSVSNTLSNMLPFFASNSVDPFKYSTSSRKLPGSKC